MDEELIDFLIGLFASFKEMKTSKVKRRVREAGFEDVNVRNHLRHLKRKKVLDKEFTKDVHGTYESEWRYIN